MFTANGKRLVLREKYRLASTIAKKLLEQLKNDDSVEIKRRVYVATAEKAAEDPRIYLSYPDIDPELLKKFPQLGKDAATTYVTIRNVVSQMLSVDINLAMVLSNMTPEDIDMHPELLTEIIPVKDLLVQRLQKSLWGKGMEYVAGAMPQQIIERHVIPPHEVATKKGLKDKVMGFFGGDKNTGGEWVE
jgi:hypothetical protein